MVIGRNAVGTCKEHTVTAGRNVAGTWQEREVRLDVAHTGT